MVGDAQRDDIIAAAGVALLLVDDGEIGIDSANLLLLGQRQVPKVGGAVARLFAIAQPRCELLTITECKHAADVGTLKRRQAVEGRGDGFHLRLHKAFEERPLFFSFQQRFGLQHLQDRFEAARGNKIVGGNDTIAQGDGLVEERLIEVHRDESTRQRVFGIEQACIKFAYGEVEVLQQHTIVEQQLYVVVFLLKAAELVGTLSLDVVVLARLLLDEQPEIGGHQVDTPLQAKPFADKRRLKDGRVTRIASTLPSFLFCCRGFGREQLGDNLLNVGSLIGGCLLVVFLLVQVGTGAIVECLLAEVSTEGLLPVVRAIAIDDVVEHTAGEITQQQRLRVGVRLQAANGIAQRMMAVALEAAGDGTDIDEVVWLHDDKGGKQRGDIA